MFLFRKILIRSNAEATILIGYQRRHAAIVNQKKKTCIPHPEASNGLEPHFSSLFGSEKKALRWHKYHI